MLTWTSEALADTSQTEREENDAIIKIYESGSQVAGSLRELTRPA